MKYCFKKALIFAFCLHGGVFLLVFLLGVIKIEKRKTVHTFELVACGVEAVKEKEVYKTPKQRSAVKKDDTKVAQVPEKKMSIEAFRKKHGASTNAQPRRLKATSAPIIAPEISFEPVKASTLTAMKPKGASSGQLDAYHQQLREEIDFLWVQPESFTGYETPAIICFTLDEYGRLKDFFIKRSSGSLAFDASVKAVFLEINQLPSPPENRLLNFEMSFSRRS